MITDQLLNDISKFIFLKDNWDSYGAKPPSHNAITKASKIAIFLSDNDNLPQIHPTADGGIILQYDEYNLSVEIIIESSGNIGLIIDTKPGIDILAEYNWIGYWKDKIYKFKLDDRA